MISQVIPIFSYSEWIIYLKKISKFPKQIDSFLYTAKFIFEAGKKDIATIIFILFMLSQLIFRFEFVISFQFLLFCVNWSSNLQALSNVDTQICKKNSKLGIFLCTFGICWPMAWIFNKRNLFGKELCFFMELDNRFVDDFDLHPRFLVLFISSSNFCCFWRQRGIWCEIEWLRWCKELEMLANQHLDHQFFIVNSHY